MQGRISLKQLRYVVALAEWRHFRKAAEAMGITQPSLSAQIADLETTLRLRLVERGRGPVTLTMAGREIVERARRVLHEVSGLEDLAATLRGGDGGTLRLGASATISAYLLPAVLHGLHRAHPGLSLYIAESTPADLEADLLAGAHDAVLTQLPLASSDLQTVPLFREPLHLVVSARHPLAGREAVAPSDLAGQRLLTLGAKYTFKAQVLAIAQELGAVVLETYEGTSLDGLRLMVGLEMGVAIMPALYVRSEVTDRDPSSVAIPFRNAVFHRTVGLAWRHSSGRSEAIARLRASIDASVRSDFRNVLTPLSPGTTRTSRAD